MKANANSKLTASQCKEIEKNLQADRDFKAHIYQQLAELQPYIATDSHIAVAVKVEADSKNPESQPEYSLRLHTKLGDFKLEAEGRDADYYNALAVAKEKMRQQLNELHSASIDSRERNAAIHALVRGHLTLH
jgi:ribosome-associated translation inhibitor RaiA